MPIIVPVEENDVDVPGGTDKKFTPADHGGSGLEALGAGLSTLGSGGQQFAEALDEKRRHDLALAATIVQAKLGREHQSNIDDAVGKNAYVGYSDKAASLLHQSDGLFNQRGANAHSAFPGVVAALADAHDQALAPLDSVQRGVVAPILAARLRSDADLAAAHVKQQGVVEQRNQAANLVRAATRDAIVNADDPYLHDHHLQTSVNTLSKQGKLENVPDDVLDKQIADHKSAAHAATIGALIPRDPVKAAGWYARFGNNLNSGDRLLVDAKLGPALANARVVADGNAANKQDPTVTPPANSTTAGVVQDDDGNLAVVQPLPRGAPWVSGEADGKVVLAAKVEPRNAPRLNGRDILVTPQMMAAAQANIDKVRVRAGQYEKTAIAYLMPDGTIEVRPLAGKGTVRGASETGDYMKGNASGPDRPLFVIHGHIEKYNGPSDGSIIKRGGDKGMVDDPDNSEAEYLGDTYSMMHMKLPVATVYNGYIGWHEMRGGQLIFSAPAAALSKDQADALQRNLNQEQDRFLRPKARRGAR